MTAREALLDWLDQVPLIDHHVHGALRSAPTRAAFDNAINEADTDPLPEGVEAFDSQLGFALRAWCAPLLDLPRHADATAYRARRESLGEAEVTARFLRAAGVSDWLVDTGLKADTLLSPAELATLSGGRGHEIVRLEPLVEELAAAQTAPADVPDAFRALLAARSATAVGTKSILAYRTGFAVDLRRPPDRDVTSAYAGWLARASGAAPRLDDPTVIAFALHEAIAADLPVQLHVGLGDRDMDLADSNPLLLTDFLRLPETGGARILLLHCYPFEREAGYLAQGFRSVFLDVGLSVNYVGARSRALIARSYELAPFDKVLFSSDAYGPADLHYLGARLWRNGAAAVAGGFVDDGEWSLADAEHVLRLSARDNAMRAYPRLTSEVSP